MKDKENIEYVRFAILDRPNCVWDADLSSSNLQFLRGFDPSYFLYLAAPSLGSSEGNEETTATHAAISLRLSYGIALEAFFGLVGAMMQAPDCVFAWLSNYQPRELKLLVTRLRKGEDLMVLPPFTRPSLEKVAQEVLRPLRHRDQELYERSHRLFVKCWTRFADDFISQDMAREYNSLKHGFRVQPGEMSFEISADDEKILTSKSRFAHTFPYLVRKDGKELKSHYDVGLQASALEPRAYASSLIILATSMHNVVSWCRNRLRDREEPIDVRVPKEEFFDGCFAHDAPIRSVRHSAQVMVADDEYCSDADILSIYDHETLVSNEQEGNA